MKGKKTGGRKKGTPNKATQSSKAVITKILDDYHDSGLFEQDIASLDPPRRLHVMLKLMEFTTPKPQAVDRTISAGERATTIEETLAALAQENE